MKQQGTIHLPLLRGTCSEIIVIFQICHVIALFGAEVN